MSNISDRTLFLVEAGILMVLGLLAIAIPGLFTLSIELLIGAALLISGCYQLCILWKKYLTYNNGFRWLGAILNIILGILLLTNPISGIITLTILLIIYFLVSGIVQIVWSWQLRPYSGWGWVAISGILALLMGAILITGWPTSAIWAIGLLFGINLLFSGIALWILAWDMPRAPTSQIR